MRIWPLAALPLLAACNPTPSPTGATTLGSPLGLTADAGFRSVLLEGKRYNLSEAKSYPLIDGWTYNLPSETKTKWTTRVETQRFKKVNAAEIYDQMTQATATQSQQLHPATRTVCYVTEREDGAIKEANIWKYDDITTTNRTLTYGTGVLWRGPAASFSQARFSQTCKAMRTQQVIAPPPLS